MKIHIFSKITYSAVLSSMLLALSPQGSATVPSSTQQVTAPASASAQTSSMWTALGSRFTLHPNNDRAEVDAQIQWLQKHKVSLYRSLKAAAPSISYVFEQTQKHGVPAELALLPIVESQFNPNAASNKGAVGIWQLMPKTAASLGVKVTGANDGRRDIVVSTNAALRYLTSLHKSLSQDWLLALAAYNYGPGNIRSALKQIKLASFWNLKKLPKETQNYVPKLLALAAVIQNPAKYNMELPPALTKMAAAPSASTKPSLASADPNTVLLPADDMQSIQQAEPVVVTAENDSKHTNLLKAILKESKWLVVALTNIPQGQLG